MCHVQNTDIDDADQTHFITIILLLFFASVLGINTDVQLKEINFILVTKMDNLEPHMHILLHKTSNH